MAQSSSSGSASLAVILRAWRERALLTQAQLAARAGLGVRTIRRLESGGLRRPRSDSVRLLADALDLTAAEREQLMATAGISVASYGRPRELPAPPHLFTGRTTELADLGRVSDATTVMIMAGIGKTALALHTAHRLADRYPDGQLFVDLHGYTEGTAPVEPGEALDRMLRALGVPGDQIPASLDERAALYRSRLAGQRVLIVLDNAAAEAQVEPLLPGTPGCLVVITSRHRLIGLDQARTISLDVLPPPDAVGLLVHATGQQRLTDEAPELLAETVELCGRLPLAIRIAAARLRSHPTWSVAQLVERLREHRHRLAELEAGRRSVAAALDLSYQQLADDVQRTYRLLGLHPGPDLDVYAAAALTGTTIVQAERLLDRLLEDHLLQEPAPGRYRFHDLVRAHAAHLAVDASAEPDRRAALHRLRAHYAYTAAAAMDLLYPYGAGQRPGIPPAETPGPALHRPAQATAWLDAELPNLLATAYHAAAHGQPSYTLRLSAILRGRLRTRGRHHDAETLHHLALDIARSSRDAAAELDALAGLAHIYRMQARYETATDHFEQALKVARMIANHTAELDALAGLARIHRMQGRYQEATDHFGHVLDVARATGDRAAELEARLGLGWIDRLEGRFPQAIDHLGRAREIAHEIGNQPAELDATNALGFLHRLQGRYELATDHFEQAERIAYATGNRRVALVAMFGIGGIHRRQGRYEDAADQYQEVLDLAREIGDRNWQFEAVHGMGRVHHATGHLDLALACHREALDLAIGLAHPADQARAHDGLAHAHHALRQPELAREHWRSALGILTDRGMGQTEDEETTTAAIRAHLAELDP
jgi:tetratricopeptide (TPR) repeat protein/transcriptional regulator with XRE-family HTH domain